MEGSRNTLAAWKGRYSWGGERRQGGSWRGKLITCEGGSPRRGCPPRDRLWVYFEGTKKLTRLVTELACIKRDATFEAKENKQ